MSDAPARDIQTAIDKAAQLGIFDLFEETARRRPGRTALTDSARSFTPVAPAVRLKPP